MSHRSYLWEWQSLLMILECNNDMFYMQDWYLCTCRIWVPDGIHPWNTYGKCCGRLCTPKMTSVDPRWTKIYHIVIKCVLNSLQKRLQVCHMHQFLTQVKETSIFHLSIFQNLEIYMTWQNLYKNTLKNLGYLYTYWRDTY